MASTKLTKSIRESVAIAVAKSIGESKIEALMKERDGVAIKIYESLIPAETLATLASLPHYLTTTQGKLYLGVISDNPNNNQYESKLGVKHNGTIVLEFADYILCVSDRYSHSTVFTINADDAMLIEYGSIDRRIGVIREEILSLKGEVFSLLSSITTVEKAIEIWPEGEEFLNKYIFTAPTGLPAIRVEKVNEAMAQLAAA